jgi:hypothetical protein
MIIKFRELIHLIKNAFLLIILSSEISFGIKPRDSLCVLVVRVLGYRSGGPVSIPGTTRKKKYWVCNGVNSASLVQLRSYLIEK